MFYLVFVGKENSLDCFAVAQGKNSDEMADKLSVIYNGIFFFLRK